MVDCVWNVIAHAQKPDFFFRWSGRIHLNRRGPQFSRLLAAEVCASAVVMLDTPSSEVVWEYWLPTSFVSFPFTSPPVRHRVSSGFKLTLNYGTVKWSWELCWWWRSYWYVLPCLRGRRWCSRQKRISLSSRLGVGSGANNPTHWNVFVTKLLPKPQNLPGGGWLQWPSPMLGCSGIKENTGTQK